MKTLWAFVVLGLGLVGPSGLALADEVVAGQSHVVDETAQTLVDKGGALMANSQALREQAEALRKTMTDLADHPLNNQPLRGVPSAADAEAPAADPEDWELEVAALLSKADATEAEAEALWRDAVAIDANAQQMILQRMLDLGKGK